MKAVIMAGGKGTRISSIAKDIPKPMIQLNGKPILEYEIESLKKQGIVDFIITVSHLGDVIIDYFGDGSQFGVNIQYYYEYVPLGNAGALFKIKEQLDDDFLLINGDIIFDIDVNRFVSYHKTKKGLVTLFTHPNSHPFDSGLLIVNENDEIINWLSKEDSRPHYYKNIVNAGIQIISPKILDIVIEKSKIDLDRDLLKPLCNKRLMYSYKSSEYVKDMGTPERFENVSKDFLSGVVKKRNLSIKQKAIFIDRDGTINKYVGFLRNIDEFELIERVQEAIKMINMSGYLAIVISNQPVIARGEVTFEELEEIHKKMETLLGLNGAYLDAIYYCPHHPHSGFKGERKELKFDCSCRKPKPGMILTAAKDFNIDLLNSWMIGDSLSDIECGKNATVKTCFLGTKCDTSDLTANDLYSAIERILKNE